MKHIISLLLFLFCMLTVQAQKMKAGVFAGLVASDIVGMDTLDFDEDFSKAGFVAGTSISLPLSEKYSAQVELSYIQKGYSCPPLRTDSAGNSPNNGYFYKLSLDYLEIPVLLKKRLHMSIREKSIDGFEMEGGLSFARLVRHLEMDNTSSNLPSSNIIKNNYSAHFGASYYFTPAFSLNVRFANSLNPVRERNALPSGARNWYLLSRGTNTVWAFTLRLIFT